MNTGIVMNRTLRNAQGQSMVEGACILPVMILLVVFLSFFLVNTSMVGTYNLRLNAIAAEAARQYTAGKWWLGMERPDFNEMKARGDMEELITAEIAALGFQGASVSGFKFTPGTGMVGGEPISTMRVEFDVKGLKTVSYGVFPASISLHAIGIASDAEYAQSRHGMALVHAVDPADPNKQRAFRVPVFNASRGQERPADASSSDPWLKAGPSLGTPPIVTMTIFVKNQGQLSLQKTDLSGGTTVLETRNWDPLN